MAFKPKKVQVGPDQKKIDPKAQPTEPTKHNCDVCGEPAVIRHSDGHYYCQKHEDLWNESVSHVKMKTVSEVGMKNRPSNFSGTTK